MVFDNLGALNKQMAMRIILDNQSAEVFEKRGKELAERLKTVMKPGSIVLDFGCGIGRPERYLAPYCREIHGVDFSWAMLRLARKRHKDLGNVHFHRNNGQDLSVFKDSQFNFVFSEAVIQHIDKETATFLLMEIYRVLKPEEEALLHFLNLECPQNMEIFLKGVRSKPYTPPRLRYWVPEEVSKVLKAIGFKITSLSIESDARDKKGEMINNDYHRGYSIWVYASK